MGSGGWDQNNVSALHSRGGKEFEKLHAKGEKQKDIYMSVSCSDLCPPEAAWGTGEQCRAGL